MKTLTELFELLSYIQKHSSWVHEIVYPRPEMLRFPSIWSVKK